MDEARSVEERLTVEVLVEGHIDAWHYKHQTGQHSVWHVRDERQRQRTLNPAYQPSYSEEDLRRSAEILAERTQLDWSRRYSDRPLRDVSALRFLPHLESLKLTAEVSDLRFLRELPRLRVLHVYVQGCEDYRDVATCRDLRELSLTFTCHWPAIDGLETLQQLETFHLGGNLLVFPRGIVFPRVRTGTLSCQPLHARSVRDLPQFPACEFLTLSGIERLDGIEEFPRLRNLTLTGPVRDFAPMRDLRALTWLSYTGSRPLDLRPLAQLPRLQFAQFHVTHSYGQETPLRDYSSLAASPSLREIAVKDCQPVEMEVAALNAALPPWDDEFLADTPRPLPPLRMIIAPKQRHTYHPDPPPAGPELPDEGILKCESRWVDREVTKWISERIAHEDWGHLSASCRDGNGGFFITIESYEVVERLPEIVDEIRRSIARLRRAYTAGLMIALKSPVPEPTPAQCELIEQFNEEQRKADFQRRRQEEADHLERLYLYKLKQEGGEPINPEEFAAPAPLPDPPPPWKTDEDDDDDDSPGYIAGKEKPDPPPDPWNNDHPLADNYRLLASVTPDEVWFMSHHRDLAIHLMQREPDLELPPEEAD